MAKLVITRLVLVNYGTFRGRHAFDFPSESLNVLVAPNEFGKTTLLNGIVAILWGTDSIGKSWFSGEDEPCEGILEFLRLEGNRKRRFRVRRNLETHQLTCEEIFAGEPTRTAFDGSHNPRGHTPDHRLWLEQHLPSVWAQISREAFMHLCTLEQPLPDETKADLLQQLILGRGNITVEQAKQGLVRKFRDLSKYSSKAGLTSRDARTNGHLDELHREYQELRSQKSEAEANLDQMQSLHEHLADLEEEKKQKEKQIDKCERSIKIIATYLALQHDLENAIQRSRQIREAYTHSEAAEGKWKEAQEELERLPKQLRNLSAAELEGLRSKVQAYESCYTEVLRDRSDIQRRCQDIEQQYGEVEHRPEGWSEQIEKILSTSEQREDLQEQATELSRHVESAQPRPNARLRWTLATLVAVGSGLIVGLITGSMTSSPIRAMAAVLTSLVSGVVTLRLYRPLSFPTDYAKLIGEMEQVQSELDQTKRELAQDLDEISNWTSETDLTRLAQLAERRRSYERDLAQLQQLEEKRKALDKELELSRWPFPLNELLQPNEQSIAELERQFEQAQTLHQRVEAEEQTQKAILSSFHCNSLEELGHEKQQWEDRRINVRGKLEDLIKSNAVAKELGQLNGTEIEDRRYELEKQSSALKTELEELQAQRHHVQRQEDKIAVQQSINVADAEVRIGWIEEEIRRLEERCEAIRKAHELLDESSNRFSQSHCEFLQNRVNDLFMSWTRYSSRAVQVASDFSIGLKVSGEPGERSMDLGKLSQGARDQLALAIRVAALERIGGEVTLPLLIDDAFLTWDAERQQRLRQSLSRIEQEHQLILVTHSAEFGNWGETVLYESE